MKRPSRSIPLVLALAASACGDAPAPAAPAAPAVVPVLAQQVPPPAPLPQEQPPAPEPAPPQEEPAKAAPQAEPDEAVDAAAAASLAEAMVGKLGEVRVRPSLDVPPNAEDPAKAKDEVMRRYRHWEESLAWLAKAADRYAKAAGPAGGDGRALLAGAIGKAGHADLIPAEEAVHARMDAAALLERALARAGADAEWRGEAELLLGRMQLFLASKGQASLEDASRHIAAGAKLLRAQGRGDEAGLVVALCMQQLQRSKTGDRFLTFSGEVEAASADYGPSTPTIRRLDRAAKSGVGAKMPALPAVKDSDGVFIDWEKLRGRPYVLHFFRAGTPIGQPSEQRDIETVLRPLYDSLHPAGLEMVGVSTDLEFTKDKVETIKKNWNEWGVKTPLMDGSAQTVSAYAGGQGIAWRWTHSGKWSEDPVSDALGGAGVSGAHALLVDADGVIRWRGGAPFTGLAEEARKLLKP